MSIKILASASYDDTINIYKEDGDEWVCIGTLASHESTVWSLSFEKSGERLASCSDDKTVKIWKEYRPGNKEGLLLLIHDAVKAKSSAPSSPERNSKCWQVFLNSLPHKPIAKMFVH